MPVHLFPWRSAHPPRARKTALPIMPALVVLGLVFTATAQAEMSAEELAKLAQNPIANLISVPFQNNANFNYGPLDGTQNILNIQPVIPVTLNENWNLITRTIQPLVWQPALVPGEDSTYGIGDMQLSAFLSPSTPAAGGWIWGVGAIAQMPRCSSCSRSNGRVNCWDSFQN